MYVIVGLGNPGEKYKNTRHNVGRIILNFFAEKNNFSDWKKDASLKALISDAFVKNEKVLLIKPETFMNNSGKSVSALSEVGKIDDKLIVVYDDLDLALGEIKISFKRGSGGHRGLDSIIKNLKTKEFVRVRVGISPKSIFGKTKKPKGEERVLNFLMRDFSKKDFLILENIQKKADEILKTIIEKDYLEAMNKFN